MDAAAGDGIDGVQPLIALERAGWEALVAGNGGAYYREHLAANAVMAFPFGILDRDAALEAIDSAPAWEPFEVRSEPTVAHLAESGMSRASVPTSYRP